MAGVDEAGRGPLAGPVVAAAAIFPAYGLIPKVADSKQLTEKKREELFKMLMSLEGFRYSVCEISAEEIDSINILRATHKAMIKVLSDLPEADCALIDGLGFKGVKPPVEFIVKGDAKSATVAAASILAKVHRDRLMLKYAVEYPEYGFDRHKGYGTKQHLEALKKHGPCPIHRKTFTPVSEIIKPSSAVQGEFRLN